MNSVLLSKKSKTNSTKHSTPRGRWQVILHNDDRITFDHVIESLMDICGHNEFQAHQCALITHNRKRCSVFVDKYDACAYVHKQLRAVRLTVTIEPYEKRD
jgi:ATP-dependent Clp protease adapter protein ClpS